MKYRAWATLLTAAVGCTVPGEDAEREALEREGRAYEARHGERSLPTLALDAALPDVLHYAFLANPSLERAYFEWRGAIERVPQAASLDAPRVGFEYLFTKEKMSRWDRTTLGASQMIPFPGKLEASGQVALEAAIVMRKAFEGAKFDLQAEVVEAYTELAATDQALAVGRQNLALLRQFVEISRAMVGVGRARQADLLKAELEADAAESELRSVEARRASDLARVNRLLSRPPAAVLQPRLDPQGPALPRSDERIFALAAERNPELGAMAAQVRGQERALDLARKAWFPDFELSFEIQGSIERMLGAMLTLPLNVGRIRAGIREAEADIRAAQAALRERADDVRARLVFQLYLARDADRQARFIRDTLLPKARQVVDGTREAYGAGNAAFLELLDAQRALLTLELEGVRMDVMRRQAVARLEALTAIDFGALPQEER